MKYLRLIITISSCLFLAIGFSMHAQSDTLRLSQRPDTIVVIINYQGANESNTPAKAIKEPAQKPMPQTDLDSASMLSAQPAATNQTQIIRKKYLNGSRPEELELVKVGKDTVPIVIPERNYGRFDRGLFNYLYIPKDKWAFGITASYGEFSTDDVQVLSMLKDIDFKGKIYSVNPAVSYFLRNNQAIGVRGSFSRGRGDLQNLALDIDEDMSFALHDISYATESIALGAFYRNYVGLSRLKRFAVFNEVSLDFNSSSSRFKRYYNDELYDTKTESKGFSLNFSPGVCVFIHDYVAFNVSFGVFGLKWNKEKQTTNGADDGSRVSSGANFKFNLFNINFGMLVVI